MTGISTLSDYGILSLESESFVMTVPADHCRWRCLCHRWVICIWVVTVWVVCSMFTYHTWLLLLAIDVNLRWNIYFCFRFSRIETWSESSALYLSNEIRQEITFGHSGIQGEIRKNNFSLSKTRRISHRNHSDRTLKWTHELWMIWIWTELIFLFVFFFCFSANRLTNCNSLYLLRFIV